MRLFIRLLAWLMLIAILIVTIGPLSIRPVTGEPANLERFLTFLGVGMMFALAYPRRWLTVLLVIIGSAAVFELAQLLVPDRHGQILDFLVKAAGGAIGVAVGYGLHSFKVLGKVLGKIFGKAFRANS